MFWGTYNIHYMFFNGALWFLPCLFSIEVIYYWIAKINLCPLYQVLILVTLHGFGFLLSNFVPWLPMGLCASCICIIFYGIGHLLQDKIYDYNLNSLVKSFFIIGICIILQIACLPITGCDIAALKFNNAWAFIPIAFIGIILCYVVSSLIRNNYFLQFLGINSLVIFAFQEPTYRATLFLCSRVFDLPIELLRANISYSLIVTFVAIIFIIPFIIIWNHYVVPIISYLSK